MKRTANRQKGDGTGMNPEYPVYIVSKGRAQSRLTSKALERMNVPYHIVIEPQEYEQYAAVIDPAKILVLPFSNLGQGSIPARNWIWEHALSSGAAWHWILDDNIRWFGRYNHNQVIKCETGICFLVIEEFVNRFQNVVLSGMQYEFFMPMESRKTPLIWNTRIYSCILIRNDIPYRWRGRYNEDTDLSLRVLKDGLCTVLFRAFVCRKVATMRMKGGNTDELYRDDGRYKMAVSLYKQHPDVVKVAYKWNRWQHQVDYRPFMKNKPILKPGIEIKDGIDNFNMTVKEGYLFGTRAQKQVHS
jgi:hypothetical protein